MSSFLGEPSEFEAVSPRMKVVGPLHVSSNGFFEIFIGERMGKKFILKALKDKYKNDPVFSLMLRKEFEIGFSLSHPGIVRILSLEEIEGLGSAIVQEYIAGKPLSALLQSGEIQERNLIELTRQLIDILAYLHENQIVHNDLKPSNIIISDFDGKPKIIDFGFADSPGYDSLKFRGGTSEYIAPERLNGEYADDPRSDIWSLGVIAEKLSCFANLRDSRKLLKMAAGCRKPVEERTRDVKVLLPFLNRKPWAKERLFFWFLLILASLFLLFFWGKFREEQNGPKAEATSEVFGPDAEQPEAATVSAPSAGIAIQETDIPERVNHENPNPSGPLANVSSEPVVKTENGERPKEEKAELPESSNIDNSEFAEAEMEVARILAVNYALRLTAEMIEKRKAEGKFHQPETRDQLLESRYEYERLMKDIGEYVDQLEIPSSSKVSLTKEARQAATDLIHEEAAKLDGI